MVAARPQLMRVMNAQTVLEQVRAGGPQALGELAQACGLSKPTVGRAVAGLEAVGLVRAAGRRPGLRGPAATLYELRPEAGFVLGLDVGRHYLRGAVADLSGTVRIRDSVRTGGRASGEGRVAQLESLSKRLLAEGGIAPEAVLQTVIGSPGVYDPRRKALRQAPNNLPGWGSSTVVRELREVFGEPTLVENDVSLAALAERAHGHGREEEDFVFVWIGTGVGMGLVLDGRVRFGAHGAAGEIAWLPVAREEVGSLRPRHHGELEAATSAAALVQRARERGVRSATSAKAVFEAATSGDPGALAVVEREAELIARAVASVVVVLDPRSVVLGGGIGQAPGFADAVGRVLDGLVRLAPEVCVSGLGEYAVVEGALVAGSARAWGRVLDLAGGA